MRKIDEKEEEEMYKIINDALYKLCQEKPNNPVEILAKNMLEIIEEDTSNFKGKLSTQPNQNIQGTPQISAIRAKTQQDELGLTGMKLISSSLKKVFLENYKIISQIGKGHHSEVFHIEDKNFQSIKKIVKIIPKLDLDDSMYITEKSMDLIQSLDHPNVAKIYEVIEDDKYVYVIMEYLEGGTLFDFLAHNKFISDKLIRLIIRQILDGVNYLHSKKIMHSDIRPENILVSSMNYSNIEDIQVRVSDYGIFTFSLKHTIGKQIWGSPYYMAPEVIQGNPDYKSDVWSIGILLNSLLNGLPQTHNENYKFLLKLATNPEIDFSVTKNPEAKFLLAKMLNKNPNLRPDIDEVLIDPYIINIDESETERSDDEPSKLQIDLLSSLAKFSAGSRIKKSLVQFLLKRKIYVDNNNDMLKLFKEIDLDGNGCITVEELYKTYGKFFPGTPEESMDKVRQFVDQIDLNKTGVIEYSEFFSILTILNEDINQKIMKEVFDYIDIDGNGYIMTSDLKTMFFNLDDTVDEESIRGMITNFDGNEDNKISFEEFFEAMTK